MGVSALYAWVIAVSAPQSSLCHGFERWRKNRPGLIRWVQCVEHGFTCWVQGLIHISELAWSRVTNPETVVQPGSLVKCKVIKVDKDKGRIGLSLKVSFICQ